MISRARRDSGLLELDENNPSKVERFIQTHRVGIDGEEEKIGISRSVRPERAMASRSRDSSLQVIAGRGEVEQTRGAGTKGYQENGYDRYGDGALFWKERETCRWRDSLGFAPRRSPLGRIGLGRKIRLTIYGNYGNL